MKFLSRRAGYSVFLTSDEAVLTLNELPTKGTREGKPRARRLSAAGGHDPTPAVVRMKLAGAIRRRRSPVSTPWRARPTT